MIRSGCLSMPQARSNWATVMVASCSRTRWSRSSAWVRVPASTLTTKAPSGPTDHGELADAGVTATDAGGGGADGAQGPGDPSTMVTGAGQAEGVVRSRTVGRWLRIQTVLGGRAQRSWLHRRNFWGFRRRIGGLGGPDPPSAIGPRRRPSRSRRVSVASVSSRCMPAVRAIDSTPAARRSGTASSTCCARGGSRSRVARPPRGRDGRCSPLEPSISRTSSPLVTSTAAPLRTR